MQVRQKRGYRRAELKDTREEWLEHQLGKKKSDIILYGEFMERKISTLKEAGRNNEKLEAYYLDESNNEKWIHEYGERYENGQLRKVKEFPFG